MRDKREVEMKVTAEELRAIDRLVAVTESDLPTVIGNALKLLCWLEESQARGVLFFKQEEGTLVPFRINKTRRFGFMTERNARGVRVTLSQQAADRCEQVRALRGDRDASDTLIAAITLYVSLIQDEDSGVRLLMREEGEQTPKPVNVFG